MVHHGLAGSASNDCSWADLFVSEEHTFSLIDPVRRSGPLYPLPGSFTTKFHGLALDFARRALDEVTEMTGSKIVMPQAIPMRDLPRVRSDLAIAEMNYRAARAYSVSAVEQMWHALVDG